LATSISPTTIFVLNNNFVRNFYFHYWNKL